MRAVNRVLLVVCLLIFLSFFLTQNPLFTDTSTYVIFAHLLRQIASFQSSEHHYLLAWFRRYGVKLYVELKITLKYGNEFIFDRTAL